MAIASVSRFVQALRGLYAANGDPAAVWPQAASPLRALLADPALVAASAAWPVSGHENLLFYEDPDHGFVLNGLIKAPGARTRVHDHAHVWVLYGVLKGSEDIVNYARLDDGADPERATIREAERLAVRPGAIELVRPYAIHAEEAGPEGSVAVILRSAKPGGFLQGRYEADGRYWQGPGVAQIPWPLV